MKGEFYMSIEEAILLDTLRCRLEFLRKNHNLNYQEAAKNIMIDEKKYLSYEKAELLPTVVDLIFIADFYQVSVDYLIGRSETPQLDKPTEI